MVKRWIRRIVLSLVVGFIALFAGDWLVFMLRGSPRSDVEVRRYLTVPLKGNKLEYDPLGTLRVPCSISIFPQPGLDPCWWVRRRTKEEVPL